MLFPAKVAKRRINVGHVLPTLKALLQALEAERSLEVNTAAGTIALRGGRRTTTYTNGLRGRQFGETRSLVEADVCSDPGGGVSLVIWLNGGWLWFAAYAFFIGIAVVSISLNPSELRSAGAVATLLLAGVVIALPAAWLAWVVRSEARTIERHVRDVLVRSANCTDAF